MSTKLARFIGKKMCFPKVFLKLKSFQPKFSGRFFTSFLYGIYFYTFVDKLITNSTSNQLYKTRIYTPEN